jgi:UDP-N-acetyl-2-amino-2-deoxyglucuronate dehydrogenase
MNAGIKFAILGCGRIAQRHAEHIHALGQLVAVCDTDIKKAQSLAEKYQAKCFGSLDEMLVACPEIDVVSVCTPNGLHAEHSIKILKAGHHVLCEKPMALTVNDCSSMITAAERANKRLFIVKQNRFNPPVEAVKALIDQGKLGKLYSVQLNCFWNRNNEYYQNSWKGTKDLDGGTLYTQFSHFIDLLYWFIGDVETISASTANFHHQGLIEFEDTGVAILKFRNGVIGTINYTVNAFKKNMEGSLTIFAEKGTVKIGGQYLNELEFQSLAGDPISNLPPGNPPNNYGQYVGSMSNHDKVYQNLISVLNGEGTIATSGMEGLKTVEIIEKIYRQANKNKTVE